MVTFAAALTTKLNLMKRILLSLFAAGTASLLSAQFDCNELFISEYVEGWGNNKALEIYNPTPNPINLHDYQLARYSNGSSQANPQNQVYRLPQEMIEAYSTWVIVIDKRNPEGEGQEQPVWLELQAKADHFANPVYNENNTMYFNGNDVMVLSRLFGNQAAPVDVIGRIGEDPGHPPLGGGWNNVPPAFTWIDNGSIAWTTDHSLIRKFGITGGYIDAAAPFNTGLEWDSIPPVITGPEGFLVGNWESLGWHDCECFPLSTSEEKKNLGTLYPNPLNEGQMLRFEAPHATERYEIYDLSGKRIKDVIVPMLEEFEIDVQGLRSGAYVFRAIGGGSAHTHKFVVQ